MNKENFKPQPPLTRVLRDDLSPECPICHSSVKRSFFGKIKGCIQPDCINYYKNKIINREQAQKASLKVSKNIEKAMLMDVMKEINEAIKYGRFSTRYKHKEIFENSTISLMELLRQRNYECYMISDDVIKIEWSSR